MSYSHRQHGPLYLLLLAAAAAMLAGAWFLRDVLPAAIGLVAVAAVVAALALAFVHLTVRDEGEYLSVRFGPLPLFGTRIAYRDVIDAQPGRSTALDGWGVHWMPQRGWIFNLWGYDCVVVRMRDGTVRIGSDDARGLAEFIRSRCGL